MNTAGRSMLISEADLKKLRELFAGMCARHRHSVALSERGQWCKASSRLLRRCNCARRSATSGCCSSAALLDSCNPAASALALGHWRIRASFGLMMIFLAFRLLGAGRIGWLEAQPDSRFGRYSWRLDT